MKEKTEFITLIFGKDVLEKCGLTAAAILSHIAFWVDHNKLDNNMKKDGVYWMYQTSENMSEYFPSLGKKAIRTAIIKLEAAGYIKVGFFSDPPHQKVRWFTLTDRGNINTIRQSQSDMPKGNIDVSKRHVTKGRKGTSDVPKGDVIYNVERKQIKKTNRSVLTDGGSASKTELITLLDPEPTIAEDSIGKLVNELLTSMMILSPKAGHADFAQRKTAEKLIKKFGIESCREHVFFSKQIRQLPYGPVVKNIYDLEQKWYELEDFVQRKINESTGGGMRILNEDNS